MQSVSRTTFINFPNHRRRLHANVVQVDSLAFPETSWRLDADNLGMASEQKSRKTREVHKGARNNAALPFDISQLTREAVWKRLRGRYMVNTCGYRHKWNEAQVTRVYFLTEGESERLM